MTLDLCFHTIYTLVSKLFSTPSLFFFMLSCIYNCQTSVNGEVENIQQKNDEVLHEVEDLKVSLY